ncbi:MAG: RluA family pseudouridine synthase [Chitinophagaceae bacterium]|nr:RluA family pseudouridine synthase [Chitinophagaceae bacterium]
MNLAPLILKETPDYFVIDKPAGLLSIPDREGKDISLKVLLKEKYGEIFTVHRLDRETSGLIIFARNAEAHKHFSASFMASSSGEERAVKKIYQGLVIGSLPEPSGKIEAPIKEHPALNGSMIVHRLGKPALTDYEVLEDFGIFSMVKFRIHTGRTHQIRVHMKEIGHPIVCDKLYGDGKPLLVSALKYRYKLSKKEEEEKPIINRLALHSWQLGFADQQGEWIEMEAPLPKDIRAALQQLRKRKRS